MKTYTLYLFRHGLTAGNINAQYIGHSDLPITTDSISALKNIKSKTPYPQVDAVISSPLKRCVQSAEIMFPENKPIIINEFKEYDFGDCEGLTPKELAENKDYKKWLSGDLSARAPNGESNAEFTYRICKAFEKVIDSIVKTKTEATAIVGHGGVLTALLACYGLPESAQAHWNMDSGYGFRLQIDPALWMRSCKLIVADTSPVSMQDLTEDKEISQ
ncbi:MAG: histidine phosphatase family protein [Clostridiales bacterium]|nr:histidine phosphatase family protein [Clostridiales bacterium]